MKHKKYNLIYFYSLLFFILSLASTTNAQISYLDSLDGKYALQFQISENFTLSNFQGAILSGKYQLGKRSAVRLGISLHFDDSNFNEQVTYIDTLNANNDSKGNSEGNGVGFTVNSQYIAYLVSTNDVGFYFGSGPTFSFRNSDAESEMYRNSSGKYTTSYSEDFFSIGLDAIAGVEWSFYKNMSLSAEYGIKFYYYHETDNYTTSYEFETRTEESTAEGIQLTANYVNFGISVYF
jgi:hypothetical protein